MAKKLFAIVALIATLIPILFVIGKVGGIENWQGIPARGTTDSLYYYARIHEVADGHPLIGHPYIYEYREEFSPSFFLPDIITAVPLLLGLSINVTIWINVFIWSFVFLVLAYTVLTLLEVKEWWAVMWSVFLYIGSYSFLLRPTVMQIIFPLFILFLILLFKFLHEPHSKKHAIFLAVVSALSFYFYSYLAFFVFLTLVFVFLWFLFSKPFRELAALGMVGVYTFVLLVPYGAYSLMQMSTPLYKETLVRIGLVYTHIPTPDAFFFGRWIFICLGAVTLFWFYYSRERSGYSEKRIFWVCTGLALLVGLFLNALTGVEAFLAVHVGRFVTLWMTLLLGVLLHDWYNSSAVKEKKYSLIGRAGFVFLILLILVGSVRNIPRGLAFFEFDDRGYKLMEMQAYGGPLAWLEENVPTESVIWSNASIGDYIPIVTKHYTLFNDNAVLHNIPSAELEERYLLWKSLGTLTVTDIEGDFGMYSGAGPSQEQPLAQNNRALFCNTLSRFVDMGECPQKTDAITLQGEPYFEALVEQFASVKEHRADLLRKYNVSYLIIDTRYDTPDEQIPESSAVYADGRFLIFPITALVQVRGGNDTEVE